MAIIRCVTSVDFPMTGEVLARVWVCKHKCSEVLVKTVVTVVLLYADSDTGRVAVCPDVAAKQLCSLCGEVQHSDRFEEMQPCSGSSVAVQGRSVLSR